MEESFQHLLLKKDKDGKEIPDPTGVRCLEADELEKMTKLVYDGIRRLKFKLILTSCIDVNLRSSLVSKDY